MTRRALARAFAAPGLLLGVLHCSPSTGPANLGGTSWRLVEFQGGDETVLKPDDPSKYTIAFQPDGRLSTRFDCNRGRGSWKSAGPPQLEFGPLALTRAMCPPGSLHDHLVKQWPYVRSYVIRDNHLFLSLMADGGIYEFEPMSTETTVELENTYWKLTHLGESPISREFQVKEPHLIFNTGTNRANGTGGCNQVSGSYEVDGSRLTLGPMIGTMMACEKGMETELGFTDALGKVSGWKIAGRELELTDAEGMVLARFEGLHMK